MSIFDPMLKKQPRALERAQEELRQARVRRAAHEASPPSLDDVGARHAWKMKRDELTSLVETHEEAVTFQQQRANAEAAAAAIVAADEAHRVKQRQAEANKKLVLEINDLAEKMKGKLAKLAEHRADLATYNAEERGDRAYVEDAERLVRLQPAVHRPARFEEREEWQDAEGRTPSQVILRGGKMVPYNTHGNYQLVNAKVVVEPEYNEPPRMPASFVEAIRLFDLAGKQIWPPSAF